MRDIWSIKYRQTFNHVNIYLPRPVFTYDQFVCSYIKGDFLMRLEDIDWIIRRSNWIPHQEHCLSWNFEQIKVIFFQEFILESHFTIVSLLNHFYYVFNGYFYKL